MKLLRFFAYSISLALQKELVFQSNFYLQLIMNLLGIVAGLTTLGVIYSYTPTLDNWQHGDMIVLLGTFYIASSLLATFIEPNLTWFSDQVKSGKLDHLLLQPMSSLFLASLGICAPLNLMQTIMGSIIIGIGLHTLQQFPSLINWLCWLALLTVGLIITWASRVLLACITFWAPDTELDGIYSLLWEFARYPISIYHQPFSFILTYILPIAFVATFPSQALTKGAHLITLIGGFITAILATLFVHSIWHHGLKRYTSATS